MYLVFADCETEKFRDKENVEFNDELKFKFLVSCNNDDADEQFNVFYNPQEFILYLYSLYKEKKSKIVVYFHNLSFDFKLLFSATVNFFVKTIPINRNSNLLAVKCYKYVNKKPKLVVEFRDSFALLPYSIKELGKSIGLEKMDLDESLKNEQLFIEYCKRDVLILKKAIMGLMDEFSIYLSIGGKRKNEFPYTAGALAKRCVEYFVMKKYNLDDINKLKGILYLQNRTADNFSYYFGGRCEVFYSGLVNNAYYYDFNSAYPFAMLKYNFPMGNCRFVKYGGGTELPDNYVGIECLIYENNHIPYAPVKKDGKLVFANGYKVVFLFKEEVDYLLSKNLIRIEEIYRILVGQQDNFFSDFVKTFYEKRLKYSNDYRKYFYKIILNSAYGKFAERRERENIMFFNTVEEFRLYLKERYNKIKSKKKKQTDFNLSFEEYFTEKSKSIVIYNGKYVYREKYKPIFVPTNIFIASKITAMVRLELYKKMKSVENGLIYCDTDSIVSFVPLPQNEIGLELGMMKLEKEIKLGYFFGNKEYWIDNSFKAKGFGKFVIKSLIDYLNSLCNLGVPVLKINKIKETIKRGLSILSYENVIKQKRTVYNKRKIIQSSMETEPINLQMDKLNEVEFNNYNILSNYISKSLGLVIEISKYVKKSRLYCRQLKISKYAYVKCPICAENINISQFYDIVGEEEDYEELVKLINTHQCPHIVKIESFSSDSKAYFKKEVN